MLTDKTELCVKCKGKNVLIACACGCGDIRRLKDGHGRTFFYIQNHPNSRAFKTGINNPAWSGGKILNTRGYVMVRLPNHPQAQAGYVLEHRLVMEQHLKRALDPLEDVHHINGIITDNRIENLQLLSHVSHTIITRTGRKASLETRQRLSLSHMGYRPTVETRRRMSMSQKQRRASR